MEDDTLINTPQDDTPINEGNAYEGESVDTPGIEHRTLEKVTSLCVVRRRTPSS